MNRTIRLALLALFAGTAAAQAEPLTIESQGSFFIGGKNVSSDTLSTLPAYAPAGTITVGLAECVAPGYVVGVDVAQSQVNIAEVNASAAGARSTEFRVASAYELPFENATFDAVFSHAVIEHLREPQ